MKRWVRLVAGLYPSSWRERYGAEFETLLEDTDLAWRDLLDVLRGGLEMQLTTWSPRRIAVVLGLTGTIVAAAIAFRMPDQYVSNSVVMMRMAQGAGADGRILASQSLQKTVVRAWDRDALADLITREDLYKHEREHRPMKDVVETMMKEIRFQPLPPRAESNAFLISFRYPDAAQAQRTVKGLVARMVQGPRSDAPSGEFAGALEILDPANLPSKPIYPNRVTIMAAGLGAGLLLSALTLLFRRLRPFLSHP